MRTKYLLNEMYECGLDYSDNLIRFGFLVKCCELFDFELKSVEQMLRIDNSFVYDDEMFWVVQRDGKLIGSVDCDMEFTKINEYDSILFVEWMTFFAQDETQSMFETMYNRYINCYKKTYD